MPVYNHENFIPLDPEKRLWRYLDFEKFKSLLESKSLFFCRADKFSDPFEGSLPKREAEYRISEQMRTAYGFVENFNEEQALKNIRALQSLHVRKKRGTLINCWHINQNESDAMWRLYLKDNEGVAIQSSSEKMIETIGKINEKIGLSKVRYLSYESDAWYHQSEYPHGNYNFYIPLIHKRIEFEHENEFRLIHSIEEPVNDENYWDNQPNHKGKFIAVDLETLIEKIYLPPTIDVNTRKRIESLCQKLGYNFQFEKSKLANEPWY